MVTRRELVPPPSAEPAPSRIRRWLEQGWGLIAFAGLGAVLAAGMLISGPLASAGLRAAVAALAVAALAVGIRWLRPDVPLGWWLILGGVAAGALANSATAMSVAASGDSAPTEWSYSILAGLQYPLLIAGVALLARLAGRTKRTDLLDAATISLATFLVLFALVIQPVLPPGPVAMMIAVVFPFGALLLLAMVIRIALSVGVPTPALGLLLAGMIARVAATVSMLVPALTTGTLQIGPLTRPLAIASYLLVGAAALHPSLARTRRRRTARDDPVSKRRMALLTIFAAVTPIALVTEVREATYVDTPGVTVPLVAAAGLLLLLVGRLSVTANMAQRRATELARRSDDLAEAVQEQQALQQQLRYQSMHDPLTGLANRIVLSERLEWALNRRAGSGRHALALLDLDRFKDVNDTFGHPVGDELLVEVSHRLLALTPTGGMLARLGGDEFAVFMEETPAPEARGLAERIRQSIREPYRIAGQDLHLSTSVGLLITEPDGARPSPAGALRDADVALYAAKAAGRNRVTVFRPELRTAQLNLNRLSTGLRRALTHEEFAVHYQPVVDLASGRVATVEALLRWQPKDRPAVAPSEFIPVAEETGLIGPIGAWVLRRACIDARPWHEQYQVSVAVNISPRQLADSGFADLVLGSLEDAGLPGAALILEITESSLVATSSTGDTMQQLGRLRAQGIRVAIDDFGTGYSSLAYVSRLPVDIVKLDRSFVQHPADSSADGQGWAFTRAVLQLVDSLRLQAVAEGVETLEQAELLRELRCQLVQGFLFGRPMPRELIGQTLSGVADGAARPAAA